MRKLCGPCLLMVALCFLFSGTFVNSVSSTMSVPSGMNYFEYPPVPSPALSDNPALAQPIGIGPIAQGGNTFDLQIGTPSFDGPVDVYFAVYAPSYAYPGPLSPYPYAYADPLQSFFIMKPDKTFQPLLQGLVPWQKSISSALKEDVFGNIPIFFLPQGAIYNLYLLITPAGSFNSYYLWSTPFSTYITTPVCGTPGLGCPSPSNVNITGTWSLSTITGSFIFTQISNSISGATRLGQPISGTISGLNISFQWTDNNSVTNVYTGTVTADGNSMSGTFTAGAQTGQWTATRSAIAD